jgi:ubiquitin C-terminal hydrolase
MESVAQPGLQLNNPIIRIDSRTVSLITPKSRSPALSHYIHAFALKALPMDVRLAYKKKELSGNIPNDTAHGKSGLHNTGNTCYLNSAIQFIGHHYPLVYSLLSKKHEICQILLNNGSRILKTCKPFDLHDTNSKIPSTLREKIHSTNYNSADLTAEERNLILSYTVTYRLIELLQYVWASNCVINPISFVRIFIDYNNPYFGDGHQHDAQEAYSQILSKIQDELKHSRDVHFCNISEGFKRFLAIKDDIATQMQSADANDFDTKQRLYNDFVRVKAAMPAEALMFTAYKEMKTYYSDHSSSVTDFYTSFIRSKLVCSECRIDKNVFESVLHIILPMPKKKPGIISKLSLYDCLDLFTETEHLGEQNLRYCSDCKRKTQVEKKISIWSTPPILVFQIARFSPDRRSKDNRIIDIPIGLNDQPSLDLTPYISEYSPTVGTYRLHNAVLHSGTIAFGHYTEVSFDPNNKTWSVYNDSRVSDVFDAKKMIDSSAYLLMYVREDFCAKSLENQTDALDVSELIKI